MNESGTVEVMAVGSTVCRALAAYKEAIQQKHRFFSYGDTTLFL